jgi:hypothetical protein
MSSSFAITSPATSVYLAENRLGKMPFTVTNMTEHPIQGRASVVSLDSAPPEWFKVVRGSELNLSPNATAQVLVQIEPPLGVAASTHQFRLDLVDPATPDETSRGPSCSFVVPPSRPGFDPTKPRGYLATLIGASLGGALGELAIFFTARSYKEQNCGADLGCAVGNIFVHAVFLVLAFLAGLVLLWIGSVVGAGIGLRIRSYLGSKTTALFLAILMIPWTLGMLWLLSRITDNLALLMILAPILLTAVPGLVARGAVLLIRTKHL